MEQSLSVHFTPLIDIGFWTMLSKKKIEEYKLEDKEHKLYAKYKSNTYVDKYSHLIFDVYSFSDECPRGSSGPLELFQEISFRNHNTIESYLNINSLQFVTEQRTRLLENFKTEGKPQILSGSLQVFADLKKYIFTYRFLCPQIQVEGYTLTDLELPDPAKFHSELQKSLQFSNTFINSPFYTVDEEYKYAEFNPNGILVYFDAFNGKKQNGTFENLLAYLITKNVKSTKILIVKDFVAIGGQKFNFKNSRFVNVDLSNAHITDQLTIPQEQTIDLKTFMDEKIIASDAVDLNIKLMKWRLLPSLDLDKIKETKCLLFGAGTLGCQVARCLIGWGVRNITFVDYGKVSYSNPVRQSLFDFKDSTNGGQYKAQTAASKLKEIFPDIKSQGFSVEIPMPGHYVTESSIQKTLENLALIDQLVSEHDAIFLLTDSREARWLPTVLANKYSKVCLAVALGFDSFLIIRHGISPLSHKEEHGDRLACYFCNDISAPQNSTKDRTLDQQCTVTRPGLSFLAAAYSSELLISLLHHPLREGAPAHENPQNLEVTDLGILPHFIRGQLSDFDVKLYYGKAFNNCVACSSKILAEYMNNPQAFILEVLNKPDYLQDVSGITEEMSKITIKEGAYEEFEDFAVIQ